ncbi:hypothetical protein VNO78_18295 [Psophocarpus tetragonolobus]|uniref:Uncharacterized protein n=1 Tax=Psophocarpus tetragonolobus TaxID=3891 RepID=A0AAN9SI42_PSOTE
MEGLQNHYGGSCSYLHNVGRSNTNPSSLCVYEPPGERVQMAVTKSNSTWWWNDAERKRKRRVAKYKLYAAEGKLKRSFKKGFRWFKIKCIKIVTNL